MSTAHRTHNEIATLRNKIENLKKQLNSEALIWKSFGLSLVSQGAFSIQSEVVNIGRCEKCELYRIKQRQKWVSIIINKKSQKILNRKREYLFFCLWKSIKGLKEDELPELKQYYQIQFGDLVQAEKAAMFAVADDLLSSLRSNVLEQADDQYGEVEYV